jgi:FkbM family methyltransferase
VALNGLTQVFCHHVAVGDREGVIEVPQFDYDKRMNFGSVEFGGVQRERLDQARGHDARRREYVRMAALDGFGFDRVDLMKIDAEGMELEVLAGAAGIIGRCRPVILAEYLKVNRRKLREALSVYGYDLFTLGFNYLCVPPALQGRLASA